MSPTSVWYHPLLKSKKKKKKFAPPFSEILDPPLMIDKYMYDVWYYMYYESIKLNTNDLEIPSNKP